MGQCRENRSIKYCLKLQEEKVETMNEGRKLVGRSVGIWLKEVCEISILERALITRLWQPYLRPVRTSSNFSSTTKKRSWPEHENRARRNKERK